VRGPQGKSLGALLHLSAASLAYFTRAGGCYRVKGLAEMLRWRFRAHKPVQPGASPSDHHSVGVAIRLKRISLQHPTDFVGLVIVS
jgi:hypothetical protein